MVYKPTRQRQFKIQPVGVSSMDGLKQMGAAFENIGKVAGNFAEGLYEDKLADATFEGQTRAQSTGALMVDGELQPWQPVAIDDITKDLRKPDANELIQKTNNLAQTTFMSAAYNYAIDKANESLRNNPINPEAVKKDLDKYLEKIVDATENPELAAMIEPDIRRAFAGSINKSQINLKARADKESLVNADITFSNIDKELTSASVALFGADEKKQNQIIKHIDSLKSKRDKLAETLYKNGIIDLETVKNIAQVSQTSIQVGVSRQALEEAIGKNDFIAGLDLIASTEKRLTGDSSINGQAVSEAMRSLYRDKIARYQRQASDLSATQSANYGSAYLDARDDEISETEIDNLNVSDWQKGALKDVLSGAVAKKKSIANTLNQNTFDGFMQQISFPENFNPGKSQDETVLNAIMNIGIMNRDGKLTIANKTEFFKWQKERDQKAIESKNNTMVFEIQNRMSPLGGYITPPEYFQSLTDKMVASGIINDDPKLGGLKLDQWQNDLSAYAKAYKTESKKTDKLSKAMESINNGTIPSYDDQIVLEEIEPKTIIIDGKDTKEKLDIMSPTTGEDALDTVVRYSAQNKLIHSSLKRLFRNFPTSENEEYFDRGVQAFNKLYNTFKMNGSSNFELESIFSVSKIPNYDLMMQAGVFNQKTVNSLATKRLLPDNSSVQRTINSFVPPETTQEAHFRATLPKSFESDNDFKELIASLNIFSSVANFFDEATTPYEVSVQDELMIDKLKQGSGINSLSSAILKNPHVEKIIMERAYDIMANGRVDGHEDFRSAIRESISSLGDSIGIGRNEDGDFEFQLFPIMKSAQESAGSHPVTIKEADLVQDVISKLDPPEGFLRSKELSALIEDVNNGDAKIVFIPNRPFRPRNSYSAVVAYPDKKYQLLHSNYNYDFNNSAQSNVFNEVMKDFENRPSLYRVLANTRMFGELATKDYYRRMNNAQQRKSVFAEMLNKFNVFFHDNISFYRGAGHYADPNQYSDQDIEDFFSGLGTVIGMPSLGNIN